MNIKKDAKLLNNALLPGLRIPQKNSLSPTIKELLNICDGNLYELRNLLDQKCEKVSASAYKIENYILIPTDKNMVQNIQSESMLYSSNNKLPILHYNSEIRLNNNSSVFIYIIEENINNFEKYDINKVSDNAKKEFYLNLKTLIDNGNVDATEIFNETMWYMSNDGQKIININPHLPGYIAFNERELIATKLFNKLFNKETK